MRISILVSLALLSSGCQTPGQSSQNDMVLEPNSAGIPSKVILPPGATTPGWVEIEFEIGEQGEVANPVIVASYPPKIYDEIAIEALMKRTYPTKEVNGHLVRRKARQIIDITPDASMAPKDN